MVDSMYMAIDQWLQNADEGFLSSLGIPAMPISEDGQWLAHYALYYGQRLLDGPNSFWEEVGSGAVLTLWRIPARGGHWR